MRAVIDMLDALEKEGYVVRKITQENTCSFPRGAHVMLLNGWCLSIQCGPFNYCDNYGHACCDWLQSRTAEVAVWDTAGTWLRFLDGNTVLGWQTSEQIERLLTWLIAQPPGITDAPF